MFKLVVLFTILAFTAARPGYLHGGLGYSHVAPIAPIVIPAAVSHSYRADYISKPVIATYSVPVVKKTIVAAPIAYHAPILAYSGHPW